MGCGEVTTPTHHFHVSVPLLPWLGCLFIGLKVGGIIAWPWLWVLSPFWIPLAVIAIGIFVLLPILARRGDL